jgi:hypothetical protein
VFISLSVSLMLAGWVCMDAEASAGVSLAE